jgi:hypothetical protein
MHTRQANQSHRRSNSNPDNQTLGGSSQQSEIEDNRSTVQVTSPQSTSFVMHGGYVRDSSVQDDETKEEDSANLQEEKSDNDNSAIRPNETELSLGRETVTDSTNGPAAIDETTDVDNPPDRFPVILRGHINSFLPVQFSQIPDNLLDHIYSFMFAENLAQLSQAEYFFSGSTRSYVEQELRELSANRGDQMPANGRGSNYLRLAFRRDAGAGQPASPHLLEQWPRDAQVINNNANNFVNEMNRIMDNDLSITSPDLVNYIYNFHDSGARALAGALRDNSTVTAVTLLSSGITDVGARDLARALLTNRTVTNLNLSSNSIGDDGALAIADALTENSTLVELNLDNNRITDLGVTALANALRQNSTLEYLRVTNNRITVTNNRITDHGARALIDALRDNQTISRLILEDVPEHISESLLDEIERLTRSNRQSCTIS